MSKTHKVKATAVYQARVFADYFKLEFRGIEYLQMVITIGDTLRVEIDANHPSLNWRRDDKEVRLYKVTGVTVDTFYNGPPRIICMVDRTVIKEIPLELEKEKKQRLEEMKQMVDAYGVQVPRTLNMPMFTYEHTMSPKNFKLPNRNGDVFPGEEDILALTKKHTPADLKNVLAQLGKATFDCEGVSMGCHVKTDTCKICEDNMKEEKSNTEGPKESGDRYIYPSDANDALKYLKATMERFFSDFEEEFAYYKDASFPHQIVYTARAYLERLAAQGLTKQDVVYSPTYKPVKIERHNKKDKIKIMTENDEDYFHNF
jgi:hypothetical protein